MRKRAGESQEGIKNVLEHAVYSEWRERMKRVEG